MSIRVGQFVVAQTLLAVGLLLAGCAGGGADSDAPVGGGGSKIAIVASDFGFQPRELRVQAQQRYSVTLRNKGTVLHDWTVDAIPVTGVSDKGSAAHDMAGMSGMMGAGAATSEHVSLHIAAAAGKSSEVAFIAAQPGEYTFYCTVAGHRQAGMEGRIIVE